MTDKWQPIETAPIGGSILVYMDKDQQGRRVHIARWFGKTKIINGCFDYELEQKPTHWMPLPEPPRTQK